MKTTILNVEEYILEFPLQVQEILREVRQTILKAAPQVQESISYGMPAYKTNGKPLVYFAAFKKHIGFYATPAGHSRFREELLKYKQGKGSVQFPINQPIPLQLIEEITKYRVKENALGKRSAQRK